MLNLNTVMIGTKQLKVLAAFYEKVLGNPPGMADEEHGFFGWQVGAAYLAVWIIPKWLVPPKIQGVSCSILRLRR